MPIASLYTICIDRVYGMARKGMWESTAPNPFSNLPSRVVDELLKLTQLHDERDPPRLLELMPILKSGRLKCLNFCPFDLKEEQCLMLRKIYARGNIDPQNVSSDSEKLVTFFLIMYIINWNPLLEELYLNIRPNFEIFKDCKNLRILRFYPPLEMFRVNFYPINVSALGSLKNLEVLHIPEMDADTMVKVLDMCPKLISFGLLDSFVCLRKIKEGMLTRISSFGFSSGRKLQLRRCVLGYKNESRPSDFVVDDIPFTYRYEFSWTTQRASALYPLLEELIIHIPDKCVLEKLEHFKQLTLLRIDFLHCKNCFVTEFRSLLPKIGPQLKHLSIICHYAVPVDEICENCIQLQSLEIEGPARVINSAPQNLCLKRLTLSAGDKPCDQKAFLFLLSNCKQLEELFLKKAPFLDDDLLYQLLDLNPFSKLRLCFIENCLISMQGFMRFRLTVSSLESFCITAVDEEYHPLNKSNFIDPNRHYIEYVSLKDREFFSRQFNENRF